MTTDERTKMERANCETCLLSQAMKDCKACKFNHALKIDTASTDPFLKFAAGYLKNIPNGGK
jgi:hypothetical protein